MGNRAASARGWTRILGRRRDAVDNSKVKTRCAHEFLASDSLRYGRAAKAHSEKNYRWGRLRACFGEVGLR